MKRVAIFGNAGGGKSTLARELAAITGLPLVVIDKLQYRAGGVKVPYEEYLQAHATLLATDEWIIDGFGCSPPPTAAAERGRLGVGWNRSMSGTSAERIDVRQYTEAGRIA